MQNSPFLRQRNVNLIVFLFFSISLGVAFAADILYKIRPCHLCIYLRYIYWVILSFSVLRLKWPFNAGLKWGQFFVIIGALALSGFHAGVEKKWWDAPSICSNPVLANDSNKVGMTVQQRIAMIRRNIESAELVRCDHVNWRILGISATIWNTLALAGVAFLLFFANRRKADPPHEKT
jgi:disulfide bond formation protein DsbB